VLIQQGNAELLSQYATISIAFEVSSVLQPELIDDGLGGILLSEHPVGQPYLKNYDVEESPLDWPAQFNLTNWVVLLAWRNEQLAGGATIASRTPGVHMLAGRDDLAVLWDIRVSPDQRGRGIGRALLQYTVNLARQCGFHQLKIETQNVNVPACRFYHRCGCRLGEINRNAYAQIPIVAHEVMLVWYMDL
jgi:ribosomal protein S18 acetylase RimI-like enzyme